MKNLDDVLSRLTPLFPLKIALLVVNGEQLIINSANLCIAISPVKWRIVIDGVLLHGSEKYNNQNIKGLEGLSIIEVASPFKDLEPDLKLTLSNGSVIEIFSANASAPLNLTIDKQMFYTDPHD